MADDARQPQQKDAVPSKERLGTRCCHCLCHALWIILVLIIILVMVVILVLYILITPRSYRFHVTDANLTRFDYTAAANNNSTLYYNLVLGITARNPNKRLKIYYDVVRAHALYQRVEFSATDVQMPWNGYLQDKKGTNRFSAVFSGQRVMKRNLVSDSEFREDNKVGVFPIDIKIGFTIRFRLGGLQFGYYYPRATCELKVPLTSNGNKVAPFDPAKCEIDF